MSTILACLGIFILFALLVAPGLAALFSRSRIKLPVGLLYGALFIALAGYHIGFPRQAHADLARPAPMLVGGQGVATELCGQILAQFKEAGIILDQPSAGQVRVRRTDWAQVPDQVKEAITMCLNAPTRPGAPPNNVEIMQVAGR